MPLDDTENNEPWNGGGGDHGGGDDHNAEIMKHIAGGVMTSISLNAQVNNQCIYCTSSMCVSFVVGFLASKVVTEHNVDKDDALMDVLAYIGIQAEQFVINLEK